jgi:hypothetical protein
VSAVSRLASEAISSATTSHFARDPVVAAGNRAAPAAGARLTSYGSRVTPG